MLFVSNFNWVGENTSVHAENPLIGTVALPIEYIGTVPGFDWLTQIEVILPASLAIADNVWVRVSSQGVTSNPAYIRIKHSTSAVTMPPVLRELLEPPISTKALWAPFRRFI